MSALRSVKRTGAIRASLVAAAVGLGLVLSSGQLDAAASTAGRSGESTVNAARAGQGAVTWAGISPDHRPDIFARARVARDALRFPIGSSRVGRHVHDAARGSDYDEVSELDPAGRAVALTQIEGDGRLAAAVRFDVPAGALTALGGGDPAEVARRALAVAGIQAPGRGRAEVDEVAGGWNVHWDRLVSGIRVRGDEVRAHVWRDGRIQSVARVEHELASAPPHRLGRAEAQQSVVRQFDAWFGSQGSGQQIRSMDLEWVGPNAAFDPAKLGAAAEPYHLAWVASVEPSGPVSESVRLITLYVDAGDGSIIGGDVVE